MSLDICNPTSKNIPAGTCYSISQYSTVTLAAFRKCCGDAPVAQLIWDAGACGVYCPITSDGPDLNEVQDCLKNELGQSSCLTGVASEDTIREARAEAGNNICSHCLDGNTRTVTGKTESPTRTTSRSLERTTATATTNAGATLLSTTTEADVTFLSSSVDITFLPSSTSTETASQQTTTRNMGGKLQTSKLELGVAMILGLGYLANALL